MMVNFEQLPAELRLCIYEAMFPPEPFHSLKPLGFRNPNMEQPVPNVSITLPTAVLIELYKSNPAGESRGRFWAPIPFLATNKQIRDEAGHVWDQRLVEVGTWMSFLSRRPERLLTHIQHVHFTYWLNPKWSPEHPPTHPHYALDRWVNTISSLWGEQLERLYCIMGANLQRMSVDMTLLWPPTLTYRVKGGLRRESISTLREKMPATLEKTLLEFRADGKWPESEVVVSDEDDSDDGGNPALPHLRQVAMVA